jgi:hypothetical protein
MIAQIATSGILDRTFVAGGMTHMLDDQWMPSIAAVPYWPSGALISAWTDSNTTPGISSRSDVFIELIPTPVVRTLGGF